MIKACTVGIIYFSAVFTVAFALGIARILVIARYIGASAAVILEVPIVVVLSWVVACYLLKRHSFSLPQSAVMGGTAYMLTMASEVVLARLLRGQSATEWISNIATPIGLFGLAGQIAFAVIPVLITQRHIQHSQSL